MVRGGRSVKEEKRGSCDFRSTIWRVTGGRRERPGKMSQVGIEVRIRTSICALHGAPRLGFSVLVVRLRASPRSFELLRA